MTARKYPARKPRAIAANGRPKAGKRGEGGGRPKADPAKVAAALALVEAEGLSPVEAAARVGGISGNTVRRARDAAARAAEGGAPAPVVAAPRPRPTPRPEAVALPPPTDNDRKVDELIATSRTWRRVCEALGRFARRHPSVAADLSSELRGLNL